MEPFRKLYSEREREKARGDAPILFTYDTLPKPFRIQVCKILISAIGSYSPRGIDGYLTDSSRYWEAMHSLYCYKRGAWDLGLPAAGVLNECVYFLESASTIDTLDAIDFFFYYINSRGTSTSAKAVEQLNYRFRYHELGYQFLASGLMRVDSEYLYIEATEPAVGLLYEQGFEGALAEFMSAHKHYLHGEYKDCMDDALKSFESTMKSILTQIGIEYTVKDTAKPLLQKLLAPSVLLPSSLESSFTNFVGLMEGVATLRNRMSGHGQGEKNTEPPPFFPRYMLNMTASNIVFLVDAYKAKRGDSPSGMPV